MARKLLFLVLWMFTLTASAMATGDGGDGNYGSTPRSGLNNATTNKVVNLLNRGIRQCQALDAVYRYDCYRQNYKRTADLLERNPAYAVPLKALRNVEGDLQSIVTSNADPSAKRVFKGGAVISAVKPSSTAKAKQTFRRSLDESQTILLRSSEGKGDHFARIAQALDSNKVLLRTTALVTQPV